MQITKLFDGFDALQQIHGDKSLNAIYGAGETNHPNLCLVFMNPTAKNVASDRSWQGLRAPWIGTKNVWKMLATLGLFDETLADVISSRRAEDWDCEFARQVYSEVHRNSLYITNLAKATQSDARPLHDNVFRSYSELFMEELSTVKPKVIITFGNQVSSILLGKNIKVSEYRKQHETLYVSGEFYKVFPVYYPVGQGMRNMTTAKEDINWILKNEPFALIED